MVIEFPAKPRRLGTGLASLMEAQRPRQFVPPPRCVDGKRYAELLVARLRQTSDELIAMGCLSVIEAELVRAGEKIDAARQQEG